MYDNHPRILSLGAATIACAMALAGCSGSAGSTGTSATTAVSSLRVVDGYTDEPDKTTYQNLLEKCGQEQNLKIERETLPGGDLVAKVLQMGSSRTMPDVLMLDNPDVPQIAATGALAPMDQLGITDGGEAAGVVAAGSYNGKLYGLQPITNTIALFYNEDLLKQAGVEVPKTWDELKAAAAKLTRGDQKGIAFSAPANYEGSWQFLPFMWSNGGDESSLNTPEVAQAIQLWKDLVDSGSASQSVVNWTQADVNDQFTAGKAAMMINGPWQFPVLDKVKDLKWVVDQIPVREAGQSSVAPLGGEVWTVPNTGDASKMAAAGKLIQCMNSDENQLALATARQTIPTKTSLLPQFSKENPRMAAFSEMVKTARARTGRLGADWPKAGTQIYTAVQLALVGDKTPEDALAQAVNS